MKFVSACAIGVSFAACLPFSAAADPTPPPPMRHLVYDFTYGTSTDLEIHTSGVGSNGTNTMNGGTTTTNTAGGDQDKGTITVDVISERTDGGLIVMVSEQAQRDRTAYPAACVVFNNTNTACDLSKKVNEEELAIVRLLGPHFFDPSQLDAKQHWKVTNASAGLSQQSDFSVMSNDGGKMMISESGTATQSGMPKVDSSVNSKIGYDANLQVLTSLSEFTVARQQQSMEQHETQNSQVTASLVTDSMAHKS